MRTKCLMAGPDGITFLATVADSIAAGDRLDTEDGTLRVIEVYGYDFVLESDLSLLASADRDELVELVRGE